MKYLKRAAAVLVALAALALACCLLVALGRYALILVMVAIVLGIVVSIPWAFATLKEWIES
jgi:uncharacterized membrane protein